MELLCKVAILYFGCIFKFLRLRNDVDRYMLHDSVFMGGGGGCDVPRECLILFRVFVLELVCLCSAICQLLGCKGLILGNFNLDDSGDKLFFLNLMVCCTI